MNSNLVCRFLLLFLSISTMVACTHIPGWQVPEVEQLRREAETGDAVSQYQMGILYGSGEKVWQNKKTAVDWFTKAAAQGHADAEYRLGLAFYTGWGVTRDETRGVKWLRKSATQGQPAAEYLLGTAYMTGNGVEKDLAWAARWYGRSAQQGHKLAQHAVGVAFAEGLGLPIHPIQACKWLMLAERSGEAAAAKDRARLVAGMSGSQVSRCEDLAERWRPMPSAGSLDRPTVRYVQYELTERGYDPGYIDGVLGPRTKRAIGQYWAGLGVEGAWSMDEVVLWLRGEESR